MYHFGVPDPGVTLPAAVVAQNSVSLKQRAELPLPLSPDRSPAPGSSHGGHPPSQPPSTKYRHPKGISKGRHPRTGLPHAFRSPSAGPLPAHPVLSQSWCEAEMSPPDGDRSGPHRPQGPSLHAGEQKDPPPSLLRTEGFLGCGNSQC